MATTTTSRPGARLGAVAVTVWLVLVGVVVPASSSAAKSAEPGLVIAKVKTAQVSRTKTRTTVKVRIDAPRKVARPVVRVRVNPTGKVARTGKTITRKVRASWSKGAWRATVKVRTGGPGKIVARTVVAGKKLKVTRKSPGKVTTKITGWDASRTVAPGARVVDTVKVTPAYGRKVLLQERVGGRWVTRKTINTAKKKKTAKIKVALNGPAASGPAKTRWRVRVPATVHAKAKKTKVRVLTRDNSRPPDRPDPSNPPTPDPERPGWPQWCGTDIWGTTPLGCYRPTISTVLDRWTYNPRCYHEQECWRKFDPSELLPGEESTTVFRWRSPQAAAAGRVNWKPLAAPDFIDHLNTYRQNTSNDPQYGDGKHRHILRPAPWSITVDGHTVPGQGGHPQMLAMQIGQAMTREDRNMRQDDHSNILEREEWINARWPDARGYWWMCSGENLSGSSTMGSSRSLFAWPSSSGHRTALLRERTTYSSFGAVIADNGSIVAVYQECYLMQGKWNTDPAYEADGVTPAIWQPPAGWVAPRGG